MIDLQSVGVIVVLAGAVFGLYTYVGYPVLLWVLGSFGGRSGTVPKEVREWPRVSLSVPAFNEEKQIGGSIRSLLDLDYPRDKLQILVVSDASTDGTDEIVRSFADEGVELLRMHDRGGKTRAENAAVERLRGEIIVNTDASIRLAPGALRPLIAAFQDPMVGVASGRDVSVGSSRAHGNVGESGYVGYEMAVRDLETRVSGIVGASGSFYAIRRELHSTPLPPFLSRDFVGVLAARENGYRAVSVPEAVCFVPRTASLKSEFRRKVRTIARGMRAVVFKRHLLNPFRFGVFAWMLFSHKVCRWALPWMAVLVLLALGVLSVQRPWALGLFGLGIVMLALAGIGWALSDRFAIPRVLSIPAFLVAGNLAAMAAFVHLFKGNSVGTWEPTRREAMDGARGSR
jgi:cellulose synthase/poly-beta-1,6-N-acetylglucosamine synthase-like glycosyltransferase